jgi:type IV secretory pathway TrbL component
VIVGTHLLASLAASTSTGAGSGLVVYTILLAVAFCGGVVTAMKGLWGWVIVGILTTGLAFFVSAFLPAKPGSPWARRFARRRGSDASPEPGR